MRKAFLLILLFSFSLYGGATPANSQVDILHQKAKELSKNGDYLQALKILNRALGYLTQSPRFKS